jgi:hypothetical protein
MFEMFAMKVEEVVLWLSSEAAQKEEIVEMYHVLCQCQAQLSNTR